MSHISSPSVYIEHEGNQFIWSGNTTGDKVKSTLMKALGEHGITSEDVIIRSYPTFLAIYVRDSKWTLRISSIINTMNGYGEKLNQ